jgi:ankyrin repeat protein
MNPDTLVTPFDRWIMATELLVALEARDLESVRSALDSSLELISHVFEPDELPVGLGRGADPQARNDEGRTTLHVGLEHNNLSARHLIGRGVELYIVAAACIGMLDLMRVLLAEDAGLANDRSTLQSPLGWACYQGASDSARLLIEPGARIDDGELRCCAGVANVELGRLLVEAGADVDERCAEDESTALHVAAAHLYTRDASSFVRFLLEAGADRSIAGGAQRLTALQIAERRREAQSKQGVEPGAEGYCNVDAVIELLRS